jgi:hypothetical protein
MIQEYLLSYGSTGEFGRFRAAAPLEARRGSRAVLRTHRGLEIGVLLCPATSGHAQFLPNTTVGQLLRLAGTDDERRAEEMHERSRLIFEDGRRLAAELGLPLEVLDSEVMLDGEQAILHHLHWAEFDERQLVSALCKQYAVRVRLHTLRTASLAAAEGDDHGCGRKDCGRREGGGCGTEGGCGTGGGCSTCGAGRAPDMKAYFAGLREQMAARADRTPLL